MRVLTIEIVLLALQRSPRFWVRGQFSYSVAMKYMRFAGLSKIPSPGPLIRISLSSLHFG